MRTLLFTILFTSFCFSGSAGHLVGGEISYHQINGDTYVIQLRMYRDCYAGANAVQQFDSVAYISAYKGWNHELVKVMKLHRPNDSTRLPLVVEVPCLPNPPDLCILEMVYSDTVVLSVPNSGLYLVNQRCCRTPDALNIIDPFFYGSTYSAFIPGANLYTENSSPVFNEVPPIALCAGIDLELDYSATDPDGDSLYYEFCTPYHGGGSGGQNGIPYPDTPAAPPFDTIQWATSYNKNYQIPSSPAFSIDHNSGIISGRPTQLGTYAFGVCVQEYRDGIFIGENRRDFQMTTTTCEIGAASIIDSAIEECIGLEVHFFNLSTVGNSFKWDFGDPTTDADTSSSSSPSYQYPDTGWYTIQLIAFGAAGCNDTSYFDYHVLPEITPQFHIPDPACYSDQSFDFHQGGVFRESTVAQWEIDGEVIPIPLDHPGIINHQFDTAGLYPVKLTYEDFGCEKIAEAMVQVYHDPNVVITGSPIAGCAPVSGTLEAQTTHAYGPTFLWYLGDSLVSLNSSAEITITEQNNAEVKLVMMTDSMCIDTITITALEMIDVFEKPQASFNVTPTEVDLYDPVVFLYDSTESNLWSSFLLNDSLISTRDSTFIRLPDSGDYTIAQVVLHPNGCADTLYKTIRVKPPFLVFIPNTFSPNGDGINDLWLPSVFHSQQYQLAVYDRWGSLIFETTDPSHPWDGLEQNSGRPMPIGTYGYMIYVENPDGSDYRRAGTLQLIR